MAARVPAGFYVLSEREAGIALACARAMVVREGSRPARELAASLEQSMSEVGHPPTASSDIGASSARSSVSGLSVAEAAALLGVSDRHARRFLPAPSGDGSLSGEQIAGVWVIERSSVEELLAERQAKRTA